VVIAEFTDIAGAFFPGGKEPGLVTAVLDRMARAAGATPARD
jgi:N utilization substance protein B